MLLHSKLSFSKQFFQSTITLIFEFLTLSIVKLFTNSVWLAAMTIASHLDKISSNDLHVDFPNH